MVIMAGGRGRASLLCNSLSSPFHLLLGMDWLATSELAGPLL